MKKTIIISLFLLQFEIAHTRAQAIRMDSITSIAKADGKNLKLTPQQKERLRSDRKNSRSDLFKPNAGNVSDVSLLKDSVYVRTFRMAAFKRYKHTTLHYVLWVGVSAYIVAGIIDTIVENPPPGIPNPGQFE